MIGEWFKIRVFHFLQKKSSSRNDHFSASTGAHLKSDLCTLLKNVCALDAERAGRWITDHEGEQSLCTFLD